jgi:hypothetical protein
VQPAKKETEKHFIARGAVRSALFLLDTRPSHCLSAVTALHLADFLAASVDSLENLDSPRSRWMCFECLKWPSIRSATAFPRSVARIRSIG